MDPALSPSPTRTKVAAAAELSHQDWQALRRAHRVLEHPSLAARLTSLVGTPVEGALQRLPPPWRDRVRTVTEQVTQRALELAISAWPAAQGRAERRTYRWLGMSSGAVGGFFGLGGLLVELPLTTLIMLRAIGAMATERGEDLNCPETRLACCEVFALGGAARSDDGAETGYYGVRIALGLHLSRMSRELLQRGAVGQSVPAMASLLRAIAARFGVAAADKAAAQMMPVLGAAGGAVLNAVFIQHFQDIAWGHFTVRSLERRYGCKVVERAYASLASWQAEAA